MSSPIPEIDAEKLDEAIQHLSGLAAGSDLDWIQVRKSQVAVAVEAARVTLATLPRWKEIEVSQWATFTTQGAIWSSALSESAAREEAENSTTLKLVAVRLTGKAKVRA